MQIIFLRFKSENQQWVLEWTDTDLYLTESQIHAGSKDSDQTARILWPDYADEYADLSLRWTNM